MYECLIKNRNRDGSVSYEYYTNEYDAIPKAPHIKIPDGAEYLLCHEGVSNEELIFGKNNFEYNWSVTYSDTTWKKTIWDDVVIDRLEYMKKLYGSVILWKREEELKPMKHFYPDDVIAVTESKSTILWWYENGMVSKPNDSLYNPWHSTYKQYLTDVPHTKLIYKREDKIVENEVMNEDDYLLTPLQACEVLLSRDSTLQFLSTDGSWIDFCTSSGKTTGELYIIMFAIDDTKFRIKPDSFYEPIEFSEVMDMLSEGKHKEVYVNKRQTLNLLKDSMRYLTKEYHDSYSKLIQNNITYDQWKNCKKGEENV